MTEALQSKETQVQHQWRRKR